MDQRLNLEVRYNGELLANAYYHWSAYTNRSINLLGTVIDAYKQTKEINPLKIAVDILQATGAGVDESEQERIKRDKSGKFEGIDFHESIDRNRGFISVTEEGMSNTRTWEESRVTVDIDLEIFIFSVMWQVGIEELDDFGIDLSVEDIHDTKFDFTEPCPFNDFARFSKEVFDNPDGVWIDEHTILRWIQ